MTLHHKAAWNDVGLLLDLADHDDDVGAEMAERDHRRFEGYESDAYGDTERPQ